MPKPTLSTDIDGTLADSFNLWLKLANERYGLDMKASDIKTYDFWPTVGMTRKEFMDIWRELWDYYPEIKPLPGVQETLGKLHKTYKVYVNAACIGDVSCIKAWFRENNIPHDRYNLVHGHWKKIKLVTDVHFEDAPPLAKQYASRGRNLVLISQPWNMSIHAELEKYSNVHVARNWKDAGRITLRQRFGR